ncbi:MAG: hypothetical protein BWY39_01213 [Spirochaetes bacterium ADurb.Bin269]|jgi:hypothetical protein|nr:MAG: hypothetical protein BWY39_01213 [Spirochaetes bacterium ADurb.Bin269]
MQQTEPALSIIHRLLPLIDEAESKFKSARTWGIVDLFGGGLITDLIKHSRLGAASSYMNEINSLLGDLQRELKGLTIPTDYSMNTGTFSTFADFLFDGILADAYMQSKILSSLDQVRELRSKLLILRDRLNEYNKIRR